MTITVETVPTYTVAYIRSVGPYGVGNARAMEALKDWARSCGLLDDESIILGIAQDDPAVTRPEDCRYDVCLVVPAGYAVSGTDISSGSVSGGKYAVFRIPHTVESVKKAWADIFPEIGRQAMRPDVSRPVMERYQAKMVKAHECEICVPVL